MLKSCSLPDVATSHRTDTPLSLQWVGMDNIAIPLQIQSGDEAPSHISVLTNLYVSLDSEGAKGIHMSRLYTGLNQLAGKLVTKELIDGLLDKMVVSQEGISQNSKVTLNFDLTLLKPALLSSETGYQSYPVTLSAETNNTERDQPTKLYNLELTIPYSSTCPCSASLSRRLARDTIDHHFQDENISKEALLDWIQNTAGSIATPHSQRSYAYISLSIDQLPNLAHLIRQIEEVIGTPVQTAVKREDELEFARLNAENLMFCEDAARKIKTYLNKQNWVSDFEFKVEHQESLHAHNAVVVDRKFS